MGVCETRVFLEEVSADVLPPVFPGVRVVVWGGVGDHEGLPRGGAEVHRHGR